MGRKGLRRAILVDLGAILAPPEGRFRCFFDASPHEQGDLREDDATSAKPTKTIGFYRFFACPRLRAQRETRPKIVPNALLDRVARLIAFERVFFRTSEPLSSAPRALWGVFGRSWDTLGTLLGRTWALLGRSWALLGRSWALLGCSWAGLGA